MNVRFSLDDAQRAADEWGANCGPGALAAIMDMTLDEVRAHLCDFERKGYTNPALMNDALRSLGCSWRKLGAIWPKWGLVRIQWEGPWTKPGVPMRVRYRHTHWVGSSYDLGDFKVFDINCICAGGWVDFDEWKDNVVPWLLKETTPKASGGWHVTHALEIERRAREERAA